MTLNAVGVGGGHDVRLPVETSAWAEEIDPGTSYSFEMRLRAIDGGGSRPGFTIWLGNGDETQTALVSVEPARTTWSFPDGPGFAVLDETDNATDFVTIRVVHDGTSGLNAVYRDGGRR